MVPSGQGEPGDHAPARGGAAVPARPAGEAALCAAPNRRKPETPIPQVQTQEAPREARRLLRLA
eukprot:3748688-Alexandrium_andersonii.AAC.1